MTPPLFVELCAGTCALSLRLAQSGARPPVSRMGAKTGYADVILARMGLRPGQGAGRYLWCDPDPGCRLLMEAYRDHALAVAAAEVIRGWADEDPRALWERLRDEGPVKGPREVARWAFLARGSFSQKGPQAGIGRPEDGAAASPLLDALPELPADIADDATTVGPREVARWARIVTCNRLISVDPLTWRNTGAGGSTFGGAEFSTPIASLAAAFDVPELPADVCPDATTVEPVGLPPGTWAYIDPPYVDTTGYAHDLPRSEVVRMALEWHAAGAHVAVSEVTPVEELVALGWHVCEITHDRVGSARRFSKQKREFLTMSRRPRGQLSLFSEDTE